MKIGLIDIDSKMPNLALMKLSAYWKKKKATVELTDPLFASRVKYDLILASKIFNFSEMPILPKGFEAGGSGFDLKTELSNEAEHIYPDYSLYNCDYAIGYTSRGCNRKCPFCIVPRKEGRWRPHADINEFLKDQTRLLLLDNSLNTSTKYFSHICKQIIDAKIEVDFSQGLDIRHINDEQAFILRRVKTFKRIHFAWDNIGDEKAVRDGVTILKKHKLASRSMFYVLIGYDSTIDEDLYRVMELRGMGVDPFVMLYNKYDQYQRDFARWVNHKAIFKSVSWERYNRKIKNRKMK
jgi:hypothetical protein